MTQPPAASPAQDPDPARTAHQDQPIAPFGSGLICDATAIFDFAEVQAQLATLAKEVAPDALRGEAVALLREANQQGRAIIAAAFAEAPFLPAP